MFHMVAGATRRTYVRADTSHVGATLPAASLGDEPRRSFFFSADQSTIALLDSKIFLFAQCKYLVLEVFNFEKLCIAERILAEAFNLVRVITNKFIIITLSISNSYK